MCYSLILRKQSCFPCAAYETKNFFQSCLIVWLYKQEHKSCTCVKLRAPHFYVILIKPPCSLITNINSHQLFIACHQLRRKIALFAITHLYAKSLFYEYDKSMGQRDGFDFGGCNQNKNFHIYFQNIHGKSPLEAKNCPLCHPIFFTQNSNKTEGSVF